MFNWNVSRTGLSAFAVTAMTLTACIVKETSDDATKKAESQLSGPCAALPQWTVGTTYAKGAAVQYSGNAYQCVQPHTAVDGWYPNAVPALWHPTNDCGSGSVNGSTS